MRAARLDTVLFVVAETVGAFLGAVYEAPVLVFDFPKLMMNQAAFAPEPYFDSEDGTLATARQQKSANRADCWNCHSPCR